MLFGKKREILTDVCKHLSIEVINSSNTLYPIIINRDKISTFIKSKNPNSIKYFIKSLKSEKLTQTKTSIKELHKHISSKSLLILVGDFLDEYDLSLLSKKHEIYAIIIRDEFEKNPTILGEREFISLNSGKKSTFFFGKKELKEWREGYEKHDKTLIHHFNKLGINYTTL